MAAKNSITNDPIITKPYSVSYGDGWEKCFLKKPQDWLEIIHGDSIKVLDADGFRGDDGVTWETPIKKEEFVKRLNYCTICFINNTVMKATYD